MANGLGPTTDSEVSSHENIKHWSRLITLIIVLCISLTGILANVLLIVAHAKDPLKCFKTSSWVPFFLNLAFMDTMICFYFTLNGLTNKNLTGEDLEWEKILDGVGRLPYFVYFPTFFSIALERFWSVAYPLWHRCHITYKVLKFWIAAIWIVSIVIYTPFWVISRYFNADVTKASLAAAAAWMILFLLMTYTLYGLTYTSLARQRKCLWEADLSAANRAAFDARLRNEKNFLTTVCIICALLVLTLLPNAVFIILLTTIDSSYDSSSDIVDLVFFAMQYALIAVNSSINPFIYVWRLPKYRKTFQKLYWNK